MSEEKQEIISRNEAVDDLFILDTDEQVKTAKRNVMDEPGSAGADYKEELFQQNIFELNESTNRPVEKTENTQGFEFDTNDKKPPLAGAPTTDHDLSVTFSSLDLLANRPSAENAALTVTEVSVDPEFGSIINNEDGTWTFTPAENFTDKGVPISFSISDGVSANENIVTAIDITPGINNGPLNPVTTDNDSTTAPIYPNVVNEAPTVGQVDLGAIKEDSAIKFSAKELLANSSDADGDALYVTDVEVDEKYGAVEVSTDKTGHIETVKFTPAANYHGDDVPLKFTVSDGQEKVDGFASLDVTSVNDGPVVGKVDLGAIKEDSAIKFSAKELLANSSDADGDALNVVSVSVDEKYGAVEVSTDKAGHIETVKFTPAENYHGDDVPLKFTVSDGQEKVDGFASLDVTSVNDGPVVGKVDLGAIKEDSAIKFSAKELLANSSDADGDALYVTDVEVDEKYGAVEVSTDKTGHIETVKFTPAANYHGDDVPLKFTVSDGQEKVDGFASLDVTSVNDGPVVGKVDLGAIKEDSAIKFSAKELLANSSDADGDALNVVSVSVDEKYGAVEVSTDKAGHIETVKFTPAENYHGDDVPLKFTVSDGQEKVDGFASLDATSVNDGPVVGKVDLGAIKEDSAIKFSAKELLANSSDADGDAMHVTDVEVDEKYGAVEVSTDKTGHIETVKFTPAANYHGDDVPLKFTVSDGQEKVDGIAEIDVVEVKVTNQKFVGTNGSDSFVGASGDDVFIGNAGNDKLSGGAGDDKFYVVGDDGLDQIDGGEGHDSIVGSRYNDVIHVSDNMANLNSVETIDGGEGWDKIVAGSGDDTLDFSKGPELKNIEHIDAGYGNDKVIGTDGDDFIQGNKGNDKLSGGAGDDKFYVVGDDGLDQIDGGEGHDTIQGSRWNDVIRVEDNLSNLNSIETIDGGKGWDKIVAGSGDDTLDFSKGPELNNIEHIDAGYGNDKVIGTDSDDFIQGNKGNDKLSGGAGDDKFYIVGDDGLDQIDGGEGHDTIQGSRWNDVIRVEDNLSNLNSIETIDGGKGWDKIVAGSGDDTLDFSKGPELNNIEHIDAGYGNDKVIGTDGDDFIQGNKGNDKLSGGAGDDKFYVVGDDGLDQIDGGEGHDSIVGSRYNDVIHVSDNMANLNSVETIDGGEGRDKIVAGSGDDTLDFSKGPELNNIEHIDAGYGNDKVIGTDGDDFIQGNKGNDKLSGGAGDDKFYVVGDDGLDQIDGGEGHDTIQGSRWNDVIRVEDNLSNLNSIETIDGGKGWDKIVAGSGDDTLDFSKGPELNNIEHIDAGYGNDKVIGTDGDDFIQGNKGNDKLSSGAGDDKFYVVGDDGLDQIDGGEGHDSIVGSRYNDVIHVSDNMANLNSVETIDGGEGWDKIVAGSGDDTLDFSKGPELNNIEHIDAGYGNDKVIGTDGDDFIQGNKGNDKLSGGAGDDKFYVVGDDGLDQIDGGEGHDSIVGSRYNDVIHVSDNMANLNSVETIDGGEGWDKIVAGSGDDTLDFSKGPELKNIESIDAGAGNDTVMGTEGDDVISGGAGNDTYQFAFESGHDTFHGGQGWTDSIQLNPDASEGDNPWTITVDGQQVEYDIAAGELNFQPDTSGVVTMADGSELTFDGVESIQW